MQRGLTQNIVTDRSQYPPQRAVELTVRLTNGSPSLVTYQIGVRREYEITVRDSRTRKVVWTWSRNKPAPPSTEIRLAPGQWREHKELWDRRDDSGRRVPEGTYEIELVHLPFREAVSTQVYLAERGQGGDPGVPSPPGTPKGRGPQLQATLQTDRRTARVGESVRLTYTVTNTGDQPAVLTFPTGNQYDLEVRRRPEPNARYREGALTIWQYSRGRSFIQSFTRLSLAPGEKKVFTESWTVPPGTPAGTYDLVGYLPTPATQKSAEAVGALTIL
ncbi:BsuPI-related putative proteinase inhibitor [Armatimonas rosea]|uniref:Intracellular proteinase inhibitor BsuPI domain-containing protein n=1 Tax=Armatimonas rosea TaxID=685828 RepID=A0A7W9SLE7_ARMRO|nr:BsuPI-related putative proteinase inhibitor [Armatimonas rosea]MBB6048309.1 hypothetical protein [Armatimonas rosea]